MTEPPDRAPRPFRRRLLVNTVVAGATNVWTILLAVVTLPLFLHGLGAQAFGAWSVLTTFSATAGWLSLLDFGLSTAATRRVAELDAEGDQTGVALTAGTALVLFGACAITGAMLLAVIGRSGLPRLLDLDGQTADQLRQAVPLFAAQCLFDQAGRGIQATLEGLQRADLSRILDAARRTLVLGAGGITAAVTGNLATASAASALGSGIVLVLAAVVFTRFIPARSLRFDPTTARTLFRYGRAVAVLRPLGVVHRSMDRLIVGVVLGPSAVAVVEIATQIQNGAIAMMTATGSTVLPSAAFLGATDDRGRLRDLLVRGTRYTVLITTAATLLPALLATPMLALWVGESGDAAAVPLLLALAYTTVDGGFQVGSEMLIGIGRTTTVLRAALASVVVNLVASVALVHVIGVSGVFLATLLSGCVLWPILGRAMLEPVGLDGRSFALRVARPVLAPAAALAVVVFAVAQVPAPSLLIVSAGGIAGLTAYVSVAMRGSFDVGEVAALLGTVTRRSVALGSAETSQEPTGEVAGIAAQRPQMGDCPAG